ncbi:NADP-dependent oxidoreductase [Gordonia sp. NPDC003585]|uniref:NADP-dependent oxidoreductase n=1 Tax=Gordonia sp. NPDC003585 TaxID=3154275 RepID=UPI0033A25ECF
MTTSTRIVATAYGEPTTVLGQVEEELPPPGPGQVTVQVQAVGVNPIDLARVTGRMGADESKLPLALGFEASGVITAVGDGVEREVGDEVIAYSVLGAYASALNADHSKIHDKPADLDFERAAGLLLVGETAADAVATANVSAGDIVLVHGGSGAVGSVVVQLAVKAGATVIATGSSANQSFISGLGAIPVTYGPGLLDRVVAAAPGVITSTIDAVGTDEAIDTSLSLHSADKIVSIAAFGRGGDGIKLVDGSSAESKAHRAQAIPELIAAAASGELVTEIASTYPLADAAKALTELGGSHPRGKIILIP